MTVIINGTNGIITPTINIINGSGKAFSVSQSIGQTVGFSDLKMLFQVEQFDIGSNFTSGTFTPTTPGYYQFSWTIQVKANTILSTKLYKNGSLNTYGSYINIATIDPISVGTALIYLNGTTDYVELFINSSVTGTTNITEPSMRFSGALVLSSEIVTQSVAPPPVAAQSMVRVYSGNGHGSTNIVIRRFATVAANQGSDITYTDSVTLGAAFTINTSGVYAISYADNFITTQIFGISLNSTQLSTTIGNITASDILAVSQAPAANFPSYTSVTLYLSAGSIIRAHASGASPGTGYVSFTITRVA